MGSLGMWKPVIRSSLPRCGKINYDFEEKNGITAEIGKEIQQKCCLPGND